MEGKKKKIAIIGIGNCCLIASGIAKRAKLQHSIIEMVNPEEAKELSDRVELKELPLLPTSEFTPQKTRAERRKEKRKKKNN